MVKCQTEEVCQRGWRRIRATDTIGAASRWHEHGLVKIGRMAQPGVLAPRWTRSTVCGVPTNAASCLWAHQAYGAVAASVCAATIRPSAPGGGRNGGARRWHGRKAVRNACGHLTLQQPWFGCLSVSFARLAIACTPSAFQFASIWRLWSAASGRLSTHNTPDDPPQSIIVLGLGCREGTANNRAAPATASR